jgi:putative restriction endonuclease
MIYLEMSRDEAHGGGTWAFPNCVWAPIEKRRGGSWPFWTKIQQVRQGDTIIHLRGKTPNAYFVGYSIASGDGFETTRRPPDSNEWDYPESFYRADLSGYTPFHRPVNLSELFTSRRAELETYFDANKKKGSARSNIFLVRQSGKLQCLNGAYLSDVDEDLLIALFGLDESARNNVVSIQTGSQVSTIRSRLGQAKFSAEIKRIYGNRCCFPGCNVSDPRFLVGAHIARWSDNEALRGHLGNGLCLCLVHDKAFELGLFTLDEQFRVFMNPRERNADSPVVGEMLRHHGEQIAVAEVLPLDDALLEHWIRVDIAP